MIKLNVFGKSVTVKELKSDNEFVNTLINNYFTTQYHVSQGNAEMCLAEHLSKMSMIEILKVDAVDNGEQVY